MQMTKDNMNNVKFLFLNNSETKNYDCCEVCNVNSSKSETKKTILLKNEEDPGDDYYNDNTYDI